MTDENKIEQLVLKEQTNKADEIQTIEFSELQEAAKQFLKQINNFKYSFFHSANFQEIYKVFKEDLGKKTNQTFMQQCFVEAEKFEDKLNHFLNREIFFTWVNPQGKILFYDNMAAQDIHNMLQHSSTNNAKGQYHAPDEQKAIQEFQYEILNKMKEKLESNKIQSRAEVYKEALKRHRQKSKKEDSKDGMAYKNNEKFKNTFWWRTKRFPDIYWYLPGSFKTYNEGAIAEAYASGVINNKWNFNNLVDLEISLQTLYKIINVDQVAAILKGDIKLEQNGHFQFQVKSPGSSSAALGQYIAMAYYILFQKTMTKEQLQRKINKSLKKNHNQAELILLDLFDYVNKKQLAKHWEEIDKEVYLKIYS